MVHRVDAKILQKFIEELQAIDQLPRQWWWLEHRGDLLTKRKELADDAKQIGELLLDSVKHVEEIFSEFQQPTQGKRARGAMGKYKQGKAPKKWFWLAPNLEVGIVLKIVSGMRNLSHMVKVNGVNVGDIVRRIERAEAKPEEQEKIADKINRGLDLILRCLIRIADPQGQVTQAMKAPALVKSTLVAPPVTPVVQPPALRPKPVPVPVRPPVVTPQPVSTPPESLSQTPSKVTAPQSTPALEELNKLVADVRAKAGFQLYYWGVTTAYNDFPGNYVRAVYQLRNPEKTIEPELTRMLGGSGGLRIDPDVKEHVIQFGQLFGPKEIVWIRTVTEYKTQRKKGFLGWLGGEETVFVEQQKPEKGWIYTELVKLNEIITVGGSEKAYFISFNICINSLRDRVGRSPAMQGQLSFFTDKSLIEKVIGYLEKFPENYYKFLLGVVPKSEFPKTTKYYLWYCSGFNKDDLIIIDSTKIKEVGSKIKRPYNQGLFEFKHFARSDFYLAGIPKRIKVK